MFDFLVYTVWACLKGVTPYKALKEDSTNKNYCDDSYSASITRCTLSFAFEILLHPFVFKTVCIIGNLIEFDCSTSMPKSLLEEPKLPKPNLASAFPQIHN